jgi:hypothetical protein
MESVITESTKNIPAMIKFMPEEYKDTWSKMDESEKNYVYTKSQLYTLNTSYQVKTFWDEQNLNGILERIEIEKNNKKLQNLNESQSTEGMMPIERVVENARGYTSNYLDSMLRKADYRK